MKNIKSILLLTLSLKAFVGLSCSPCGVIDNLSQSITGTVITLGFDSNAGWDCCYTGNIEIVCAGNAFTGVPNYTSSLLCLTPGNLTGVPYAPVAIDISAFCPGVYSWRVSECAGIYSTIMTFTVPGVALPLAANITVSNDTICLGESVNLDILTSGGCGGPLSYTWTAFPGLSNYGIANPVATPAVTTTYGVTVNENSFCNQQVSPPSVTIFVLQNLTLVTSSVNDTCGAGLGSATALSVTGQSPFTYTWPASGTVAATLNNLTAGLYTVDVIDDNGCDGTVDVLVDEFVPIYQGSTTIVSCAGGSDGTAFAEMVPAVGALTWQWNDVNAQTTQTAVGLPAGQYTCTITSSTGCSEDVIVDVLENLQLVASIFALDAVSCNSGSDGVADLNVIQGIPPYSYSWTGSSSTSDIATNLSAGQYTCTIIDDLNCTIDFDVDILEPDPLDITFITPYTEICPEEGIWLNATGIGGSSPHTFTWFENGNQIGTGDSIYVEHDNANTEYCVVLSEDCGSPTDEECTIINFHTAINPATNYVSICHVNRAEFQNLSSNNSEIATTYWDFGEPFNPGVTTLGLDSTSNQYEEVGIYDVTMTVTSIYGCVYIDILEDQVEILGDPIADFDLSVNPTTIFETSVFIQDHSSSDVAYWDWDSPYSVPSTATGVFTEFEFPIGEVGSYPITLFVETADGCRDSVTVYLSVIERSFFAPNSFTPDGDEFNQTWKPEINGIDPYDFELLIFNRWGELIWENHDPEVGWDGTFNGKIVQTGAYVWKAVTKDKYTDSRTNYSGTIQLLK